MLALQNGKNICGVIGGVNLSPQLPKPWINVISGDV